MRGADVSSDLAEFAFESEPAEELAPELLARLVRQCWSSNLRAGLTGELRLEAGRFVQVVEGRCADVLRLAGRILADPRHGAIRVIALRALPARRHAAWSVKGFDLAAAAATAADPAPDSAPLPAPANLRFLQARAAARALEVGCAAS
jgi:hypothetical protein